MNTTQQKRLLNVAKALRESQNPKLFRMDAYVWGQAEAVLWGSDDDPKTVSKEIEFCGTPACALGHFAARTDLQSLMRIKREVSGGKPVATLEYRRGDAYEAAAAYRDTVGYDDVRVQNYFGIGLTEADDLFGPDGCGGAKTPKAAAKYIENFVKRKLAEQKQDA